MVQGEGFENVKEMLHPLSSLVFSSFMQVVKLHIIQDLSLLRSLAELFYVMTEDQ